jgi:hypothetical protein
VKEGQQLAQLFWVQIEEQEILFYGKTIQCYQQMVNPWHFKGT